MDMSRVPQGRRFKISTPAFILALFLFYALIWVVLGGQSAGFLPLKSSYPPGVTEIRVVFLRIPFLGKYGYMGFGPLERLENGRWEEMPLIGSDYACGLHRFNATGNYLGFGRGYTCCLCPYTEGLSPGEYRVVTDITWESDFFSSFIPRQTAFHFAVE